MKKGKLLVLIIIIIFNLFKVPNIDAYPMDIEEEKVDVLFISSFNTKSITFDDQLHGIIKALDDHATIRIEYMGLDIFESMENEKDFYNLLKHTFNIYGSFDAIIAGDDQAIKFCLKYRDDLFKDIPISFLGAQDDKIEKNVLEDNMISGVLEVQSIEDNIELIKKFHPKVDTITFIHTYNRNENELIIEHINNVYSKKYKDLKFDIIFTNNMSMEETRQQLSKLDKNDAVIQLYVNNFTDRPNISKEHMNKFIAESCKGVPIYNVSAYDVGYGSIGGKVINHFNQGYEAGKIVLKLLNKENEKKYILMMIKLMSIILITIH